MRVIWVTSFNDALYKASGRRLVNSFNRQSVGELQVYHECDMDFKGFSRVKFQSIKNHEMLQSFLQDNRDIIPRELGGDYKGCNCDAKNSSWQTHIRGCPFHWFNKSVYRWFRKIVALKEAFRSTDGDDDTRVIWIDCDVWFISAMSAEFIEKQLFDGMDFFYIQGSRAWPETGIFGFNLDGLGRVFFTMLRERYMTGMFRQSDRWDDCWQIMELLEDHPEVCRRDILQKGYGHVFRKSILSKYLGHSKGDHGKQKVTWGWYQ